MSAGATRNVAFDFTDELDADELLTGTPAVVDVGPGTLTLTNKTVNTSALIFDYGTPDQRTVAIGKAVQFSVTNVAADTMYVIKVTVSTTSTPEEVLVAEYVLHGK